jgi:hypothetical protein
MHIVIFSGTITYAGITCKYGRSLRNRNPVQKSNPMGFHDVGCKMYAHTSTYNTARPTTLLDSIDMRMRNLLTMLALVVHNLVVRCAWS